MKITFLGAGNTILTRNIIGDCLCCDALKCSVFALYDIDKTRLEQTETVIDNLNCVMGGFGKISCYLGVENRKEALKDADFVVNTIQVGGLEHTKTDFDIPKEYGLLQTFGDTVGIGGIMRGLRTIPVVADFARDMEEVCPDALFLNYTNPMATVTGYVQTHTGIKTVGLCHSASVCVKSLFDTLCLDYRPHEYTSLIAGINHMAWLLELKDREGKDAYPLIRAKALEKLNDPSCKNKIRLEYIKHFGYYVTESSEHNAEYSPFYIKKSYPELIEKYNIPVDEFVRKTVMYGEKWQGQFDVMSNDKTPHVRTSHDASRIMEAVVTGVPYKFTGNVVNSGKFIENLPENACVEVPCVANKKSITPTKIGQLPIQLAAMNMTNINSQLLTVEAAYSYKKEHIYHAAMLDPHTSGELDINSIVEMVDKLISAHGECMKIYK